MFNRLFNKNYNRLFYGWWMVASAMFLMFFTTGVSFFGFSAFFDPIRKDLGWTRAQAAQGPSIQEVYQALVAPFVGFLVDRFGPRKVITPTMFISGFGFIILARVTAPSHYFFALILIGTGMGWTAYVMVNTAINNWFIKSRGKALGATSMGPGFGGIIVALVVLFIDTEGWRTVANSIGIITWAIAVPLTLILRGAPENYGSLPDGRTTVVPKENTSVSEDRIESEDEAKLSFTVVLKDRSYWLFIIACGCQQMAVSAMVVHHIPALVSFGLTSQIAGFLVLIFTLSSLPLRFFAGYLADKYDPRIVFMSMLILQLCGAVILIGVFNIWVALLFELTYGIGWGGSTSARLSLQGHYWGRSIFGSLMGIQIGSGAIGGFIAPILVGWVADASGYRFAFSLMVVPLLFALIMIYFMRAPNIISDKV